MEDEFIEDGYEDDFSSFMNGMNSDNEPEEEEETDVTPRLVYVMKVGTDGDGENIYHFYYSERIDDVWTEQWGEKPACNCRFLKPDDEMIKYTKELKTNIVLTLGQDSCCSSYQDVCDGCIAIAYENIDEYEEYPEPFRIVIKYGETIDEVDKTFAQRDLKITFV